MRKGLVLEFWDRSEYLHLKNGKYRLFLKNLVKTQLKEDSAMADITTNSVIDKNSVITAKIISNQDGIVAGIEEASLLAKNEKLMRAKKDGASVKKGDVILEITGNARDILGYERTLLNILQRMCGIATATFNVKKLAKDRCSIAATRKTLLHLIDKKAVSIGKGLTHRLDLSDFILIKDNHLAILGNNIRMAIELSDRNSKTKYIEIEVKNKKEALEAAKTISSLKSRKSFAILFDNMNPVKIKNSINKIKSSYKTNNLLFEASGGINQKNIAEYSKTGVDVISLGFLTHSPKAFDMSLDVLT